MKYVCLVYHEEAKLHAMSPAEMKTLDHDSGAYDDALTASGHLIVAQALQPVKVTKTVRNRKGKVLVTDGPFTETKEQLLGFLMIEGAEFAEAVKIAGVGPLAKLGVIEVRPVYNFRGD